MSQHSAIVDDDQADSKPVGRSRWRDRLFSSESWRGKIVEEQGNSEDEVAQFLGVPTTKIPSPPNAKVQLDTSIKLQTPTAPLESDLSPIQDYYRRPRPPLRKGLTVSFVETAPIIIGEGGDEAELPARDVAKAPGVHGFHDAQHSLALRRRSTGYSNHDHRTADMHDAAKSWGQISNGYTRETPSSYTLPEKEKHPSSRGGRSLRGTSHDESAPVKDSKRDPLSWQDAGFKIPQTPDTHRMASTKHSVQKGHSPNRTPSPQTQRPSKTASPSPSRVVNARDIQPAINPVAEWVAASEERGTSPSHARPGGKTRDLRTIAKGLGQDALDEFDVCVATVSGYFKASVSAKQDLMDISFSAWIRAATWWFLKGRQELETAVRSKAQSRRESEGNDEESPSRSVMQAYVDLAKARWIVQDVAPNHPDVKKYGNASMPSMVAIIENFGDKELSDLVEVHIAIVANLRALTMSMKRNGRLPPQPFEIQGQDTRIFLEYPNLPRHAVEHDKGASMKSSDRAAVSTIPVGDTKRYFYMARAFMKSTLVNRQRGREEVRIPCIMSILQDKQQGDLIARVTSQDGQLNFLIGPTSSKHYSLTWRQLQWVKSSNTISIPLSRDFELQSVLAEKDFENVWEMCGSYQKAKVAFAKEDHEQLFFECTLHHFERLETPNEAGAFPQGSIRGCGMRVFLRKAGAVDQPTARRKFRLVVTTPPDIKSLRALSTEFASDRIIVLGTCSPEDGPSLTMRTASNPALLIGFNSEGELGIFRTLICNSSTTATDVWFEPWALRRYAVDNASRSADSLQSSNELLKRFPWRSIQIIERRQEQQQNVQSLHSKCLRLVVDSGHGLMVDVLNTRKVMSTAFIGLTKSIQIPATFRSVSTPKTTTNCTSCCHHNQTSHGPSRISLTKQL